MITCREEERIRRCSRPSRPSSARLSFHKAVHGLVQEDCMMLRTYPVPMLCRLFIAISGLVCLRRWVDPACLAAAHPCPAPIMSTPLATSRCVVCRRRWREWMLPFRSGNTKPSSWLGSFSSHSRKTSEMSQEMSHKGRLPSAKRRPVCVAGNSQRKRRSSWKWRQIRKTLNCTGCAKSIYKR